MAEVSQSIMRGLNEMLSHAEGKLELRTREVTTSELREFTADEIR